MKYNLPGGWLKCATSLGPAGLSLTVSDGGPGMEAAALEKIFEPFYCVDPSRSRKLGGAGLGLAIVKHILDSHGWTIGVQSSPGKGTAFTILIPASACQYRMDRGSSRN